VADAAPREPAVADYCLLPLPQVEDRRPAAASSRWAANGGARGAGTQPRPQRGRHRQPGRENYPPVGGPERGLDGAKRLAGRKRHILLVDTNGLVLAARVHGADLPDRDGGRRLLEEGKGLCRGWSYSGPTARTRAGFASGCGAASFGVAPGSAAPPRPTAVALRVRVKPARFPGA
jgi:hypothetical protein